MEGTIIHHPDMTPAVVRNLFSQDGTMLMKTIEQKTGAHIFFERHIMIVRVYGSQIKIKAAQKGLVKGLFDLCECRLEIQLCDGVFPADMMKRVLQCFGPHLQGLKKKVPSVKLSLDNVRHIISIVGTEEVVSKVEAIIHNVAEGQSPENNNENLHSCPICLCEVEDSYMLEDGRHEFCHLCLVKCESAMRSRDSFPLCCAKGGCGAPILLTDLRSLLTKEKLDELFSASLGAYVATSGGIYRYCPSPDCPSIYRVADTLSSSFVFSCGGCFVETCAKCHQEYHPDFSCEEYQEFKDDPDRSLKEWCMGKDFVKACPSCGLTIEKVDGCNHIECR